MDTRQLKVCATCFDLSVSLLRVLEMTVTLVPEVFLDAAQPTSEMLLQRLAQVSAGAGGVGQGRPWEPQPPTTAALAAAEPGAEPGDGGEEPL